MTAAKDPRAAAESYSMTKKICTADHDTLKATPGLWMSLRKVGEMHDKDIHIHLELRNCGCGSTLALPLPGHRDE